MKKTLIAAAIFALASASAMATGSSGYNADAVVTGSVTNSLSSSSGGYAVSTGNGPSSAYAKNTQSASGFVYGGGDLDVSKARRTVTIDDCDVVGVKGTLTTGNVYVVGGSQVAGTSIAKTSGDASAQAIGSSQVLVQGSSTLTSPKINLEASGFSANSIVVDSGVVSGDNGYSKANGATGSGFKAFANGEIFEYKSKDGSLVGDTKNLTTGGYAFTGQTSVSVPNSNPCYPNVCVKNDEVANNGALGNVQLDSQAGFGASGTVQTTVTLAP